MEKHIEEKFFKFRKKRTLKLFVSAAIEIILGLICVYCSNTHPELPALVHALCKAAMIAVVLTMPIIALNFIRSEKDDYEKAQNETIKQLQERKTVMETKLRQLIKEAMVAKAKNKCPETENRYQTLKNVLEAAQKLAKEKRTEVTDSFIIDAAKKEIKQAQDLLDYYTDNPEKSTELNFCIKVASELLPAMASDEAIVGFIQAHKNEANNIGAMMKLLKAEFGDALDCKKASQLVKENL